MLYDRFKQNMLAHKGVNSVLENVRYYMMLGEEMRRDMEERIERYNNNLYLFFLAPNNPEVEDTVDDLAKDLDLELEVHDIVTADGYKIQIHRIPGSGQPVLLQHGLMCTSACWLTSGKESLAYLLSKAGYDVWMGNIRGNRYGQEHVSFSPESQQFWKFTFHHFGKYDIPAAINKIVEVTGAFKISYIGHSMGSTSLLVAASQAPQIIGRLGLVVLLAPVAAGQSMQSSLAQLTIVLRYQKTLVDWLGLYYLPPKVPGMELVVNRPLFPVFSNHFLKNFAGFVDGYTGSEAIINHLPSTASTYTLLHFSQNFLLKEFMAFDWGNEDENLNQYGQPSPPEYLLDKLKVPVAIFSAVHDTLSPPSEHKYFSRSLPNLIQFSEVDLSHLGFLWGKNAKDLVYTPILKLLREVSAV